MTYRGPRRRRSDRGGADQAWTVSDHLAFEEDWREEMHQLSTDVRELRQELVRLGSRVAAIGGALVILGVIASAVVSVIVTKALGG